MSTSSTQSFRGAAARAQSHARRDRSRRQPAGAQQDAREAARAISRTRCSSASGHRMEPTAKALELEPAIRSLLDEVTMLRAEHQPFDPKTSTRTFALQRRRRGVDPSDAAAARDLAARRAGRPAARSADRPRGARGRARSRATSISPWARSPRCRSGSAGSFCGPSTYVSVAAADHPRLGAQAVAEGFRGRAPRARVDGRHRARAPARRARARSGHSGREHRVPRADVHGGRFPREPYGCGGHGAGDDGARARGPLRLACSRRRLKMPRIDVSQYWHERFHREPGSQWVRGLFVSLFQDAAEVR